MKKSLVTLMTSAALLMTMPLIAGNNKPDMPEPSTMQANNAPIKNTQEPFQQAREKLKQMTPEQRQAFMKDARIKWDKLSPDEKQKFKVQMREKMNMMKKQKAERKMVKIYSLYLLEQQQ